MAALSLKTLSCRAKKPTSCVLILQSLKDPHGPKKHSISNIHGFSGFPVTSSIQGLNVVKFKKQAFQLEASTAAKLAKQQMFLQHANPVSLIPKPRQVPYPAQRLVLIPLKVTCCSKESSYQLKA
ncbi:hypothetical protein V8B55DRAFT_1412116 [Mucor lusitanicus]